MHTVCISPNDNVLTHSLKKIQFSNKKAALLLELKTFKNVKMEEALTSSLPFKFQSALRNVSSGAYLLFFYPFLLQPGAASGAIRGVGEKSAPQCLHNKVDPCFTFVAARRISVLIVVYGRNRCTGPCHRSILSGTNRADNVVTSSMSSKCK